MRNGVLKWTIIMPIYADAGCIRKNPSPYGVTWCWILVENDELLESSSGVTSRLTTNNQAEFYAILKALESMPNGWSGEVYSDSQIALNWWGRRNFDQINIKQFKDRGLAASSRLGVLKFKHVKGHVNKSSRGTHHSWQQLCDDSCHNQAKLYSASRGSI
jgi:ribonuclease HI